MPSIEVIPARTKREKRLFLTFPLAHHTDATIYKRYRFYRKEVV
jgi:hypothetical protein